MKFDPATNIQNLKQFGEFGDVNPSITDSSTYTFMTAQKMIETFSGDEEGCFLYSRHWNPSNKYLAEAMAAMENTESAWVTASGMAAITTTILQLCNAGDHIITSVTTYGGTFAFLKNYLPKFNIEVSFVNISDLESVTAMFLTAMPARFRLGKGDAIVEGAIIDVDDRDGRAASITRVRERPATWTPSTS